MEQSPGKAPSQSKPFPTLNRPHEGTTFRGQSNSTSSRVLALKVVDSNLIPSIPQDSLEPP